MAAISGKWKLLAYENREAFLKALGYSDAYIQNTQPASDPANDVQEEYIVTDTDSTLVVYIKGEEKYRDKAAIGKEVPFTDLAKRSSKLLTTLAGNTLTTVQDFGDFKGTYLSVVDGDNMVQTLTSSTGVVATRKFKRA